MNSATGDRKGEGDDNIRIKLNINETVLGIHLSFFWIKPPKTTSNFIFFWGKKIEKASF
jgi:hypothetical protein